MLALAVAELATEGIPAAFPRLGMMVECRAAALASRRIRGVFYSDR